MKFFLFMTALTATAVLSADQLTLKNGSVLNGSFLGGDARAIRFAVENQVKTFQLADVRSVAFGDAQSNTPAAAGRREDRTSLEDRSVSPAIFTLSTSTNIIVNTEESLIPSKTKTTYRATVDSPIYIGQQLVIPRVHRVNL